MTLPTHTSSSLALLLAGAACLPQTGLAQTYATSQPVVQAVPGEKGMRLNAALARLGRNPQDVAALIDAGRASLDLGDVQAAIGFYQRAATLAPDNARVKSGLAGAYVLSEDPFTAIPLFAEAEQTGPIDPERIADRGLAFDLVGDNATAQTFYRQALVANYSDETVRRLALSQAIAGDRRGMDQTLSPLIQKQDKAAWRTRAFALAILGNAEEAEVIAKQTVPAAMAGSIAAYLRYMPKLTPSQQAAAANLGHFPRAAEIGRDDPRVAMYARPKAVLAAAAPVPPAKQQGKKDRARKPEKAKEPPVLTAATPPPAPKPRIERDAELEPVRMASTPVPSRVPVPAAGPISSAPSAQIATVTAAAAPASLPASSPKPAPAILPPPPPAPRPAVQGPPAPSAPGFATLESDPQGGTALRSATLAQAPTAEPVPPPPPAPAPVAAVVPAPPAKPRPSLDEAFADIAPPSREIEVKSGAVDVRKVKAAPSAVAVKDKDKDKAKDKAEAAKPGTKETKTPPKPSHPSRTWVQVATGRDRKALGFDWNKMVKADAAVFKARKGYVSAWGQTNRLLTGPFDSEASANAFIAQLRKAGVNGAFVWTSPAGQAVDALAAGK